MLLFQERYKLYYRQRVAELRNNKEMFIFTMGTAVAQWLRCCATNRKVAGSIPDGVIGIFH